MVAVRNVDALNKIVFGVVVSTFNKWVIILYTPWPLVNIASRGKIGRAHV
jgi:hypothetical protein